MAAESNLRDSKVAEPPVRIRRQLWRDPAKILGETNLQALAKVCRARLSRVTGPSCQRRLGMILRKVERAHELARSRAWIEAFIGEPAADMPKQARGADR